MTESHKTAIRSINHLISEYENELVTHDEFTDKVARYMNCLQDDQGFTMKELIMLIVSVGISLYNKEPIPLVDSNSLAL